MCMCAWVCMCECMCEWGGGDHSMYLEITGQPAELGFLLPPCELSPGDWTQVLISKSLCPLDHLTPLVPVWDGSFGSRCKMVRDLTQGSWWEQRQNSSSSYFLVKWDTTQEWRWPKGPGEAQPQSPSHSQFTYVSVSSRWVPTGSRCAYSRYLSLCVTTNLGSQTVMPNSEQLSQEGRQSRHDKLAKIDSGRLVDFSQDKSVCHQSCQPDRGGKRELIPKSCLTST